MRSKSISKQDRRKNLRSPYTGTRATDLVGQTQVSDSRRVKVHRTVACKGNSEQRRAKGTSSLAKVVKDKVNMYTPK